MKRIRVDAPWRFKGVNYASSLDYPYARHIYLLYYMIERTTDFLIASGCRRTILSDVSVVGHDLHKEFTKATEESLLKGVHLVSCKYR